MREKGLRGPAAVIEHVEDFLHITQIYQPFGAIATRVMSDEHEFIDLPRRVTINDRVLLAVQATAVAWFLAVAGVRQTAGIAVVSDGQHLAEVRGRDHGPDLQPFAGGAAGEGECQAQVDDFKAGAFFHGIKSPPGNGGPWLRPRS